MPTADTTAVDAAPPAADAREHGSLRARAGARWQAVGTPRQRAVLLVILMLACSLRVGWAVAQAQVPTQADPQGYFQAGRDIADGKGYPNQGITVYNALQRREGLPEVEVPASAYYPIGYPAVLGGLFFAMQHSPLPDDPDALAWAATMLNALFGCAAVALTFLIARRVLSVDAALVATAAVGFAPNLVFHSGTLHLEPLALTMLLGVVLLVVSRDWGPQGLSRGRIAAIGLTAGATALVRPTSLLVLVAVPVVLLISRCSMKRVVMQSAALALLAGLVLTPWAIRNTVRVGTFVPISTGVVDAMCVSRNPDADGRFILTEYCESGFEDVPFDDYEATRYRTNSRRALEWAREHPGEEIVQWFWRMFWAYRHDHDALEFADLTPRQRDVAETTADVYFFVLAAFAVIGVRSFARRNDSHRLVILATALLLVPLPALLYGDPRYKVVIEPLFAIFAASALVGAWTATRRAPSDAPRA